MRINGRAPAHTPTHFDSEWFTSAFGNGFDTHQETYRAPHAHKSAEWFYPQSTPQGMDDILNGDNRDLLDQALKNKSLDDALLKSLLYHACMRGKCTIAKYLIEVRNVSPHLNVFGGLGHTGPIFKAAAESGNLNLVRYLYEVHHADIESQGLTPGTRSTALSRAAKQGHEDVVQYLISKGADVNPEDSLSNILNRAIESKKLSIVTMLVEAGTQIDNFSLGRALESGVLDIVQYLLKKRPGIKSHQYTSSPACMAVRSGNVAFVKYLEEKEGIDLFEKQNRWEDPIDLLMTAAAESGSIEMLTFLLDEKGLNGKVAANGAYIYSILNKAVKNRQSISTNSERPAALKLVQFLMETRGFVLPKEELERLVVESARFSSIEMNSYLQSYLRDSALDKHVLLRIANLGLKSFSLADLLRLHNSKLIKKGEYDDFSFEIHAHIKERNTSIEQLRSLFLENKQIMGEALFYYSSFYYKDNLSPLKLLLELGVDLNAENAEGLAAIHVALQSGGHNSIVQFYIDNKANLFKKNHRGQTAAEIISL